MNILSKITHNTISQTTSHAVKELTHNNRYSHFWDYSKISKGEVEKLYDNSNTQLKQYWSYRLGMVNLETPTRDKEFVNLYFQKNVIFS